MDVQTGRQILLFHVIHIADSTMEIRYEKAALRPHSVPYDSFDWRKLGLAFKYSNGTCAMLQLSLIQECFIRTHIFNRLQKNQRVPNWTVFFFKFLLPHIIFIICVPIWKKLFLLERIYFQVVMMVVLDSFQLLELNIAKIEDLHSEMTFLVK